MRDSVVIEQIQRVLTRLVGIAEHYHDTASVEALLRAKQEIAKAAQS